MTPKTYNHILQIHATKKYKQLKMSRQSLVYLKFDESPSTFLSYMCIFLHNAIEQRAVHLFQNLEEQFISEGHIDVQKKMVGIIFSMLFCERVLLNDV
jgi:hypothetical protein